LQSIDFIIAIVAFVAGALFASRKARRRFWVAGHFAGQIEMKERVRSQVSQGIESKNISVRYRDGREISAEQLLDLLCYKKEPDPADLTRGTATYNPH
jgi:hypothetical protein